MFDHSALERRLQEANDRLDKAARGGDPFAQMEAKRYAEKVVSEGLAAVNVDNALSFFKAAQSQPKPLFEANSPPGLTQSSNAGGAPSRTRVPAYDASGSTIAPNTFPQSSNYGRPDGSDRNIEEQRRYAEKPDSNHPLEVERQLQHLRLLGRVDPPKNYSDGERQTMAQIGHAMPDGSLAIGRTMEIPLAVNEWKNGDQSDEGKAHIKRRAKALDAEWILPPGFRSDSAKAASVGTLRKW